MEIKEQIENAKASGVTISLTPDGKVRLDGDTGALRIAKKWVRAHRAAVVEYLKINGATAQPSPEVDLVQDAVELGIEDEEPAEERTHQFTHCPRCLEPLFAPSPAIQVQNFDRGQRARGSDYFWWTESQLKRLEENLVAHPDHVLILPAFAHSVNIRRPDGSVYTFHRVK